MSQSDPVFKFDNVTFRASAVQIVRINEHFGEVVFNDGKSGILSLSQAEMIAKAMQST